LSLGAASCEYCARLHETDLDLPVFAIPTTYYRSTAEELTVVPVRTPTSLKDQK
jgi:hypothetical protein